MKNKDNNAAVSSKQGMAELLEMCETSKITVRFSPDSETCCHPQLLLISIDSNLDEMSQYIALLHEMCHIHLYCFYKGNYPETLTELKIEQLVWQSSSQLLSSLNHGFDREKFSKKLDLIKNLSLNSYYEGALCNNK